MLKVQIDREHWSRGCDGMLYNPGDGKMCCLGFVALKLGFSKEEITDVADPETMAETISADRLTSAWPETMLNFRGYANEVRHTAIVRDLITINDQDLSNDGEVNLSSTGGDITVDDEESREDAIKMLMEKAGVEVEFV